MVTAPCDDLLQRVERAVLGGVQILQLRNKSARDDEIYEQGRSIVLLLNELEQRGYSCSFIINDRLSVAKELKVGLHLGWEDFLAHAQVLDREAVGLDLHLKSTMMELKGSLSEHSLLGLTIHDKVARSALFAQHLSYVGVGPIFRTTTKADVKAVLGIERFEWVVKNSRVPVVGIGGISKSNIASLKDSGAMALALCSAFCSAIDPKLTAHQLLSGLED